MISLTQNQMDFVVKENAFHKPVMLKEVLEGLKLRPDACVLDCTLGLAGHAQSIAEQFNSEGRLVGIDRDKDSLELAIKKLADYSNNIDLIHEDYRNLDRVLSQLGIDEVNGIIFDLGISSYQLNDPERGFSFNSEGPLDMRMDQNGCISAFDLVNSLSEREISNILRNYGQERWHQRIARTLVRKRSQKPISTTKDLSESVVQAIPARYRRQRIHPATRTFQAFRIAVNRELEALSIAIEKGINHLAVGGRICAISFHSLEDRIIKEKFREFAKSGQLSLIVKKPLRPTEDEVSNNPRSRSARLRIAERIN